MTNKFQLNLLVIFNFLKVVKQVFFEICRKGMIIEFLENKIRVVKLWLNNNINFL